MANSIEYAKIYLPEMLDKQMKAKLTSGWMEANSSMIKYNGGNEIKIAKMTLDGLGDYDRSTGYSSGDATLTFETHTFDMDRSKKFTLDSMDIDESNFTASVSNLTSEFQATKVVPEVDAYRYSTIFSIANTASKTTDYVPAVETILTQLRNDISTIKNLVGEDIELVITMSTPVATILENSAELSKYLRVDEFKKGEVSMKVKYLDDSPIIKVPSARMQTAYVFGTNGFTPDAGAKPINWIITAKNAPIGIVKTDKVKIINPDVNQDADAYIVALRKYHTLIMPDNKVEGIWVNYNNA
jgi:hypothetical protein